MPGTVEAAKAYLSLPRSDDAPDLFLLPARAGTEQVSVTSYLARGCALFVKPLVAEGTTMPTVNHMRRWFHVHMEKLQDAQSCASPIRWMWNHLRGCEGGTLHHDSREIVEALPHPRRAER